MPKTIEAIYEDGVIKPLGKIFAEEHEKLKIIYSHLDEESPIHLLKVAEKGESFDFLKEKEEDIYTANDGEDI